MIHSITIILLVTEMIQSLYHLSTRTVVHFNMHCMISLSSFMTWNAPEACNNFDQCQLSVHKQTVSTPICCILLALSFITAGPDSYQVFNQTLSLGARGMCLLFLVTTVVYWLCTVLVR